MLDALRSRPRPIPTSPWKPRSRSEVDTRLDPRAVDADGGRRLSRTTSTCSTPRRSGSRHGHARCRRAPADRGQGSGPCPAAGSRSRTSRTCARRSGCRSRQGRQGKVRAYIKRRSATLGMAASSQMTGSDPHCRRRFGYPPFAVPGDSAPADVGYELVQRQILDWRPVAAIPAFHASIDVEPPVCREREHYAR